MVELFGIFVLLLLGLQIGKTIHTLQHIRMLLAQHRFLQRQRLSMDPLGLLVLALLAQHSCQIVHARQRIRTLSAKHLVDLPEMENLHLIRLQLPPNSEQEVFHPMDHGESASRNLAQ